MMSAHANRQSSTTFTARPPDRGWNSVELGEPLAKSLDRLSRTTSVGGARPFVEGNQVDVRGEAFEQLSKLVGKVDAVVDIAQ